jgi:formamidopyrimidine-DNA glycosylase
MPELPEVETYVRELEPLLAGRVVTAAEVRWARTVAAPTPEEFTARIVGQRFTTFGRRAKYMLLGLTPAGTGESAFGRESVTEPGDTLPGATEPGATEPGDTLPGDTLIVHLRMTGHLFLRDGAVAPDGHTHVIFSLDDGRRLHFQDPRKFGRIWLTHEPDSVLRKLGPEPLSDAFSGEELARKLQGRKAAIKALLLDQALAAGVGNIYADEALFRARLHPLRAGGSLSPDEIERLRLAVAAVLTAGIAAAGSSLGGSSLQNYSRPGGQTGSFQEDHRVFRRTGEPCHTCGAPIARIVVGQRSTHYCPQCQG